MARQIVSTHPLAANVVSLVGVEDDGLTIKDFADPARTATPNAAVTIGSGAYGYHMQTSGSGTNALSVSLSPTVKVGTLVSGGIPDFTTVMVVNKALPSAGGAIHAFLATGGNSKTLPWIGVNSSGNIIVGGGTTATPKLATTTGGFLDTTEFMVAVTRDSQVHSELYVDGVFVTDVADGIIASNDSNFYSQIGGYSSGGWGWRAAQVVWVITFNKILTATEISDLYASLGANNQIGLLETGTPTITPVSFSGPIADQIGYTNTAFNFDLGPYFSGNGTPFSFALQSGSLDGSGLSVGSSGLISGTPTVTGTYTGIVVRATDSESNVADTNSFSITVNEYTPNNIPTFIGPNITDISVIETQSMASINVATRFSDADTLTFSTVGVWPTGISVSSAGLINGTTNAAVGTYANLRIRATDTASQTVDSNAFSVIVQEYITGTDGLISTEPLRNNAGTLLANVSGIVVYVYDKTFGDKVAVVTGLTTDASGVLSISDAAIDIGTEYRIVVVLPDGGEGLARYIAS